jgi:hypothetical protein
METETTADSGVINGSAYAEHLAYMAKLETADIYDRCGRCGKLQPGSIYPYCVRCQRQTERGDRPTWGGVPEPRPTE